MDSHMSAALVAAALVGTAAAPLAQGEKAPPATVLILPFGFKGEGSPWTGVAIAEGLIDFVAQVNHDNFLTLKELDAVLRPRALTLVDEAGIAKEAGALARALGATDVVQGKIERHGDIWVIEAMRTRVEGGAAKSAKVQGPRAVLPVLTKKLAGELLAISTKVPPLSKDQRALEEAAHCTGVLARQSLSPRAKGTLDEAVIKDGEAHCRAALELDPELALARAGLSVALACKGQYEAAKEQAQQARKKRFVPLAVLAESFALRRAGDAIAARTLLDETVAQRPGFLHALGYLAEDRLDARDNASAKVELDRYLKRAPTHPWALAKLGQVLSRMGNKEEGLRLTVQAVGREPHDPDLSIELASRLIDSGKDAEAEQHLRYAMEATPPRTKAGLRLGYLYLRGKRLKEARELFEKVIAVSTRTDESRTRAVAQADLARVAALEGKLDEAVQHLGAAREEGMRKLPCDEAAFAQWKGKPELEEACKEPAAGRAETFDEDESVVVEF
jgi:tetratricopeptide (TPR) repeat protein